MNLVRHRSESGTRPTYGCGWRAGLPSIVAILAVAAVLLVPAPARPARAAGPSLHDIDWPAVFASDPTLTVVPPSSSKETAPGLHLVVPLRDGDVLDGYVLVPENVEYGDLDGDGVDEAAIYIFGGISFHSWGFLLYHEDATGPRRILVQTGDGVGVRIQDRHLILSEPFYRGFEDSGLGSSTTYTVMDLVGDELVPRSSTIEPRDVQQPTVEAFYRWVSQRSYEEAYEYLSPTFQAAHPFDAWRAGFASTESVEAKTTPGDTPSEVWVHLTVIEKAPDGSKLMHEYRGSWTLTFSPERRHWVLDRASIEQVS